MATENLQKTLSVTAGADLSAKQYCHVKLSANRTVVAAGNGEKAIGVLQDKPGNTKTGCVAIEGVTKILFGGTVNAGDYVSSAADGTGVVPAAGEVITGICLVGGASGEVGEMILKFGIAP